MTKLRCWPGCTARLIDSDFPENVGKLVVVLERDFEESVPCWIVRALAPMHGYFTWQGTPVGTRLIDAGESVTCADRYLVPITPHPDDDTVTESEVRELYQTDPVHAPAREPETTE